MKRKITERIRRQGLKATPHRIALYTLLLINPSAQSIDELYYQMVDQGFSINLSTVYRILDRFEQKHLLSHQYDPEYNKKRYQLSDYQHCHYLTCMHCNGQVEISHCPIDLFEQQVASQTGYAVSGHSLEFYGCCPKCQNK